MAIGGFHLFSPLRPIEPRQRPLPRSGHSVRRRRDGPQRPPVRADLTACAVCRGGSNENGVKSHRRRMWRGAGASARIEGVNRRAEFSLRACVRQRKREIARLGEPSGRDDKSLVDLCQ